MGCRIFLYVAAVCVAAGGKQRLVCVYRHASAIHKLHVVLWLWPVGIGGRAAGEHGGCYVRSPSEVVTELTLRLVWELTLSWWTPLLQPDHTAGSLHNSIHQFLIGIFLLDTDGCGASCHGVHTSASPAAEAAPMCLRPWLRLRSAKHVPGTLARAGVSCLGVAQTVLCDRGHTSRKQCHRQCEP